MFQPNVLFTGTFWSPYVLRNPLPNGRDSFQLFVGVFIHMASLVLVSAAI